MKLPALLELAVESLGWTTVAWRAFMTIAMFIFLGHIVAASGLTPWSSGFIERGDFKEQVQLAMASELNELNTKIDQNAKYQKCSGLRQELRTIKNAIFEAESQDPPNRAYIRELRNDLEELQGTFNTLKCPEVLA